MSADECYRCGHITTEVSERHWCNGCEDEHLDFIDSRQRKGLGL